MYPPERASEPYKKGYRDCRDGRPMTAGTVGTFYHHDYLEGWNARWHEAYWDAQRDNEVIDIKPTTAFAREYLTDPKGMLDGMAAESLAAAQKLRAYGRHDLADDLELVAKKLKQLSKDGEVS